MFRKFFAVFSKLFEGVGLDWLPWMLLSAFSDTIAITIFMSMAGNASALPTFEKFLLILSAGLLWWPTGIFYMRSVASKSGEVEINMDRGYMYFSLVTTLFGTAVGLIVFNENPAYWEYFIPAIVVGFLAIAIGNSGNKGDETRVNQPAFWSLFALSLLLGLAGFFLDNAWLLCGAYVGAEGLGTALGRGVDRLLKPKSGSAMSYVTQGAGFLPAGVAFAAMMLTTGEVIFPVFAAGLANLAGGAIFGNLVYRNKVITRVKIAIALGAVSLILLELANIG